MTSEEDGNRQGHQRRKIGTGASKYLDRTGEEGEDLRVGTWELDLWTTDLLGSDPLLALGWTE